MLLFLVVGDGGGGGGGGDGSGGDSGGDGGSGSGDGGGIGDGGVDNDDDDDLGLALYFEYQPGQCNIICVRNQEQRGILENPGANNCAWRRSLVTGAQMFKSDFQSVELSDWVEF